MLKNLSFFTFFFISVFVLNGQNTPPSCVITMPHNNAYFKAETDITIKVYASDLGGTQTGGSVAKVEFFKDNVKLGESSVASSNTYTFKWVAVPAGKYRITAKATDNADSVFTSAGVIITVGTSNVNPVGLTANKGKYLANIIAYHIRSYFKNYWYGLHS